MYWEYGKREDGTFRDLVLGIPTSRNILGEGDKISYYMSTFLDLNLIDVTIQERDALNGGEFPPNDLAIYTDGFKMDEDIDVTIFCPNPFSKRSYICKDSCTVFGQ